LLAGLVVVWRRRKAWFVMKKPLVVIAVGGNSLIADSTHMSVMDQYQAAGQTSHHIASLVEAGYRVVVTHGNGPQVGFILMRSELARTVLHQVPLESCVADTQGAIGYQIEQTLLNELRQRRLNSKIATVVTQVIVAGSDPAFTEPTKPIGPFYGEAEARQHEREDGWVVREDAGRGWRRVVPSPLPLEIVELEAIRILLENDVLVIAVGGGGIPVVRNANGDLEGVPAVIDKDAASCLLAKKLGADTFIISTAVDKVMLHYGQPQERALDEITLAEARAYLAAGHFAAGSMQPKIEAAISFIEQGGQRVIITQPHLLEEAIAGRNGTHIIA
jgi:carbamate kinase